MPTRRKPATQRAPSLTIGRYPAGMTNLGSPEGLPEGTCRNAVNVDVLDNGQPRRRAGHSLVLAATDADSLWSNGSVILFREGTVLRRLTRSPGGVYTATTLRSGLAAGERIIFLDVNGDVHYSNGHVTGKLAAPSYLDGPWGVERPSGQPVLAALGYGGMHGGTYQVCVTFRSASGEEGGTGVAATVTVPEGGGIALSNIPQPTTASHIRVYCSMSNGDLLYYYGEYPAGQASLALAAFQSDLELQTQFCRPPPPGSVLCLHNGRIYVAQGPVIWFTDALRYGLYRPAKNFLLFADEVRVLAAVVDGIYVGTDSRTFFASGIDTDGFSQREVLPYGAASGTLVHVPKTTEAGPELRAWFSHRGWVIAGPGGQIRNVMEERNGVSKFRFGTALFRETGGVRQFVAVLRDGQVSGLPAQDYLDFEIARRGSAI